MSENLGGGVKPSKHGAFGYGKELKGQRYAANGAINEEELWACLGMESRCNRRSYGI
jgi:hypothetical protein